MELVLGKPFLFLSLLSTRAFGIPDSSITDSIRALSDCDGLAKPILSETFTKQCNIPPPNLTSLTLNSSKDAGVGPQSLCYLTFLNLKSLCSSERGRNISLEKGSNCSSSESLTSSVKGEACNPVDEGGCFRQGMVESLSTDEKLRCPDDAGLRELVLTALATSQAVKLTALAGSGDMKDDSTEIKKVVPEEENPAVGNMETKNDTMEGESPKKEDLPRIENLEPKLNNPNDPIKPREGPDPLSLPEPIAGVAVPSESNVPVDNKTESAPKEVKDSPVPESVLNEQPDESKTPTLNNGEADGGNDAEDVHPEIEGPSKEANPKQYEAVDPVYPEEVDDEYEDAAIFKQKEEPSLEKNVMQGPDVDPASSSFFSYFILLSIVTIVAYLVFHNKKKILGLILEGRRQQSDRRRSGGREYRKLDSNLEDTMESGKMTSMRNVIY